ncbi:outer membrane protein [Halodurantibacterium flavum]|uniref:Outer membrane protein n=1 Tax=Halodurantibacterium flavum TaxID=1382802 RepID=A0ABW4S4Y6_9RHOB
MPMHLIKGRVAAAILGTTLISPAAALAGGITPVPMEPTIAPPAPVVVAPVATYFAGPYAGASLGWGFAGDDIVGLRQPGTGPVDYGTLEPEGFIGGVHVGYRFPFQNFVLGGELGLDGTDISDNVSVDGVDSDVSLNYLVTAKATAGVLARPDLLIYALGGVAHGDYDYSVTGTPGSGPGAGPVDINGSVSRTGWIAGLGVEYAYNPNWSVRGEWNYVDLGRDDLTGPNGYTTATTMNFHSVRVGVNFSF